jgi:hypothetical protein
MKTFKELQDFALRYFDEAEDADTSRALVKDAIAAAHTAFLSAEKWPFMLYPELSFTTVPGQKIYSLSPLFSKPLYFWSTQLNRPLSEVTDSTYLRAKGQAPSSVLSDYYPATGGGDFALWGMSPVAKQPAVASLLSLSASSVGEPQGNGLFVRGEDASGEVIEETITLNSPTSTVAYRRIISVRKVGTWTSIMTLRDAAANVLLVLSATEVGKKYPQLEFLTAPTASDVIPYRFYRKPSPLVEDVDLTDFPEGFELWPAYDALLSLATYNAVERDAVPIWTMQRERLDRGLREMQLAQSKGAMPAYINYIERD